MEILVFYDALRRFLALGIVFNPIATATSCQGADFFPGMIYIYKIASKRKVTLLNDVHTYYVVSRHEDLSGIPETITSVKLKSSR